MNTTTTVTRKRAMAGRAARYNPLMQVDTAGLVRQLDAFERGYLREAAQSWEAIEQRDDLIRGVVSKRKKSMARHGWTVLTEAGLTEGAEASAREQARALEYFYRNLTCEHAVEAAEQGGFKLLVRQMMDAVGKRYAVHEIVWRAEQGETGRRLVSANFRFVPLGFFEGTTGELRFLETEHSMEGAPLDEGAWMVTTGDGLMVATSLAWKTKELALNDWLNYSEHNGRPGLRGVSSAARDSDDWRAMEEALAELQGGGSVVTTTTEDVKVVDLGAGGSVPFPRLVERMDRMIAALWRGADLSTLSRDRGYGASLQEKEACALEEDDAEMITETLNRQVDRWVIRHVFGPDVKPLARVKVLAAPKECTEGDLRVDEFLYKIGAPLGVETLLNRYGRALPKAGERILIAHTNSEKASRPESSHNLGSAEEGMAHEKVHNQGDGLGPSVNSRGGSPDLNPCSSRGLPRTRGGNETLTCVGEGVDLRNRSVLPEDEVSEDQSLVTSTATGQRGGTLSNQFTRLQDDWVQLSPYGDFPHSRGLQRVDRTGAELMVGHFNSFLGRMGRLFGGVPFYVGHPDMSGAHELADRKAYGWITEVGAREDGIYGKVKWSEAGEELLRNAHYKYVSPYWEAKEIGRENGQRVFRPVALISVGLTNTPNIPVKPLANESQPGSSRSDETLTVQGTAVEPERVLASGDADHAKENQSLITSTATGAKEDQSLGTAACAGQASTATGMEMMNSVARTANLGARKGELLRRESRIDQMRESVARKMQIGLSYDEAWANVKRERADWFE